MSAITASTPTNNARRRTRRNNRQNQPDSDSNHTDTRLNHDPASLLHRQFSAVRISFTWMGVRKSLSREQKAQAAEPFGAHTNYLSAAKKLLDTRHPAFREVARIRYQIQRYWRHNSLPFPESGVRLVRRERIEEFNRQMVQLRDELHQAVEQLDRSYAELLDDARNRLGRLFNHQDYPTSLGNLFGVEWDFPSVEPPEWLRHTAPSLYHEESQRIRQRFNQAVELAEQAFMAELNDLVEHLVDRLRGESDSTSGASGGQRIFRDSAVRNLRQFFERFRALNIHSHQGLDELVRQAESAISGIEPQDLRNHQQLREQVARNFQQVRNQLDQMMIQRPRRRILRPTPAPGSQDTGSNGRANSSPDR